MGIPVVVRCDCGGETRGNAGDVLVCERCGKPIGKLRLQAFPRATLCVSCKQLEERR